MSERKSSVIRSLAAAGIVLLLGCSIDEDLVRSDSGLVDTWEYTGDDTGSQVTILWRFQANGGFTDNTLTDGEWAYFSGNYTIQDDRLLVTLSDGPVSTFRFSVFGDRLNIIRLAIDNVALVFSRSLKTVTEP